MRVNSQNEKTENILTTMRAGTSEYHNIQFTAGSNLQQSLESQKDLNKLETNQNELAKSQKSKNAKSSIQRQIGLGLKDSENSVISESFNRYNHKINVTPNANNYKHSNTQNMNQSLFKRNNTQKPSINQFSFWSVVQIRKMMERIKKKYSYANLTSLQYELIGDKSVYHHKKETFKEKYGYNQNQEEELPRLFNRVSECCRKTLRCHHLKKRIQSYFQNSVDFIPVFNPSNPLKLFWDFLISLSLLLFFFAAPIHIAVSSPITQIVEQTLLYVCLVLIVVDTIVSINTGYFSKGQIVTNRFTILQFYLKNQLFVDIISIVPFFFTIPQSSYSFFPSILTLLIFIKFGDFSKIFKKLEEQFLLRPTTTNIVELLKLLFVLLFVAHLGACVWMFEGLQSNQQYKWFLTDKLDDMWSPQWLDLYVKAYYFNTVTMVTVGYGDIYPVNNYERILSIGTILVACCIFAYIVNSIGNIFQDFFRHAQIVKENFYTINNYMEKKNISSQLRNNIKEYLSYYWDEERGNLTEKEQKIICQLPESLKKELKVEANKIVLKDNPIFHQNFSKFINDKICGIIQEQRCHPEQIIMKEDEQDDCSIYFIQKGRVEVFIKQLHPDGTLATKSIMILEKGQYFGTYGFFTGLTRKQSIRCMEFSQFLVIKRSDFIETLKQFSDDYERFCMLKDQLMFNSKNSGIDQSCFGCSSKDHFFLECPAIHYAPNQQEIIKKYNFTSTHHVRRQKKRNFTKYHTLKEMDQTFRDGIKFIEQNESFLLEQDWLQSVSEDEISDDSNSDSYSDSREALDHVDKNHVLTIFSQLPNTNSSNQLQQTAVFYNHEKQQNQANQNDSKIVSNLNSVNNIDASLKTHLIEEPSSNKAQQVISQANKERDDFNLSEANPSPISKLKKVNSEIDTELSVCQKIQSTQKIKLNPHNSIFQQEQEFKHHQKEDQLQLIERKKEQDIANNQLKLCQSQNFIDVSLGPNQANSFNFTFKQDSEKLIRRQSYWNMKVNIPASNREIQIPLASEQQLQDNKDNQKPRKQSNTIKEKIGSSNNHIISDIISNETKSLNGENYRGIQTFNQIESHQHTNASLDLQSNFTKSKILMGDMLNMSESDKSLPQIQKDETNQNEMNLLCVFDIQRFDDIEGIYAKNQSPKFVSNSNRRSQAMKLEDDFIQNNGGETERGLLENTSLNESQDIKQAQQKVNGLTIQHNKLQNKQFDEKAILRQNLVEPIKDNKVENKSKIIQNLDQNQKQFSQNEQEKKIFNMRIPIEKINLQKESQQTIQEDLPDIGNYKRLPVQRKQVTHQTSIELNHAKPIVNQLINANQRQSVQHFQSNFMVNSIQTQNTNSKPSFTNSNIATNQQLGDQHPLTKLGKSNRNLMIGSLYNKDKQQIGNPDQIDQKAIKREKFWKNVQKHGYDMGATDVSSPLILKAKKKLVEINSEGGQIFGANNKLMNKIASNASQFSNPTHVEDNQRFTHKGIKSLKKDYSPTSSIMSQKKVGTDNHIQSHESAQIEQLKQMISNLLMKFEETKGQSHSQINAMSRKSVVFDKHSPLLLMHDYIEENKHNQIQNSPLISKYQLHNPASPQIPQQYPLNIRNSDDLINSNNMYNQELIQEIIFDTMKNYSKYFPENNIQFIQNELNKVSQEKLKQMKKQKIKKAKANYQLFNSLEHLSRDQQFKRRILNSKFAKQSLMHNTRQEQSEEELNSERSRSNSGSNSKRRSLFFGIANENFSHAVNSFKNQKRQSLSQQSISTNQIPQINQGSHIIPPPAQKFSQFKN
ncbi:cyclic nucleotide-binding domain protein (macronuclear) [Tetrahymena thermophila SB210]|uniref:Cyclic nucleotide-binding domain protein n=1 Tax=Tetrahymena thermophila (strain SB210) TaxID=312017 RepID=Q22G29_TETTS|nr:cyclic nucleotide-binding domain protein [Tetrahymena thermophila SB210]EAR84197.2 cyclic nucleotide-binding domain protein [Tetrahymena thermophila SB210]|eukprot:XP_001031860.2 cyclic nucleotide-binding domain protein [Tetrahymena thermophila SB210]